MQDDNREWFLGKMTRRHLGLLSEAEESRFELLRKNDVFCREQWAAFQDQASVVRADVGHLPSTLIGRWPTATREVRGLERWLIRRHLENCEECRSDLVTLGFTPELAHVPELEISDVQAGDLIEEKGEIVDLEEERRRRQQRTSRPSIWQRFAPQIMGGWATLASAATILLLVGRMAAPVRLADSIDVPPAVNLQVMASRSDGQFIGPPLSVALSPTRTLIFNLPDLDPPVDMSDRLHVRVVGPGNPPIEISSTIDRRELLRPPRQFRVQRAEVFEDGLYEIQFSNITGDGRLQEIPELRFRIDLESLQESTRP